MHIIAVLLRSLW